MHPLNDMSLEMRRVLGNCGNGTALMNDRFIATTLHHLGKAQKVRLCQGQHFPKSLELPAGEEFDFMVGYLLLAEVHRRVSNSMPSLVLERGDRTVEIPLMGVPEYRAGRTYRDWVTLCQDGTFPPPNALRVAIGEKGINDLADHVANGQADKHDLVRTHLIEGLDAIGPDVLRDLLMVWACTIKSGVFLHVDGKPVFEDVGRAVNEILTAGACT